MGFIYKERTILIVDRSNVEEINNLINEIIVKLRKLSPNAKVEEFQVDKDHAYTIVDLPFVG